MTTDAQDTWEIPDVSQVPLRELLLRDSHFRRRAQTLAAAARGTENVTGFGNFVDTGDVGTEHQT